MKNYVNKHLLVWQHCVNWVLLCHKKNILKNSYNMKDLLLKTAKFGLDDFLKLFFFTINLLGLLRIFINFLKLKIKINQNEINETHKKQSSWHPSNSLIVFALDRKCSIF